MNSGSTHDNLSGWLEKIGRRSLCVVSPHFDDAVYSAFAALTHPFFNRRMVATVVTRASAGRQTYWANLTGFADAQTEHIERSKEDERVLSGLGVEACHLGGEFENESSMSNVIQRLVGHVLVRPEEWAVLIPAAAGRTFTILDNLLIRVGRSRESILNGAVQQHADHLKVRDETTSVLKASSGYVWGYYAENPYLTADPIWMLQRRVETCAGHRLRLLETTPGNEAKLAGVEGYASQAKAILGTSGAERVRFASRPEVYFVP